VSYEYHILKTYSSVTIFALELMLFAVEAHTVTIVKFPVHCNTMKYHGVINELI